MILYTGGTFDVFHYGHMMFLRSCQKISSKVVVALNTDEFVESYKAQSPILSYKERAKSIKLFDNSIEVVENVGGQDSKPAILSVSPDIIAIGDDWCKRDYYAQMNFTQGWLDENDILLVYIPYTKSISTSSIKSKIISLSKSI
jgi:glycerol-3-phosphate cytidylyltransferase